jgi:hypothetical protein
MGVLVAQGKCIDGRLSPCDHCSCSCRQGDQVRPFLTTIRACSCAPVTLSLCDFLL